MVELSPNHHQDLSVEQYLGRSFHNTDRVRPQLFSRGHEVRNQHWV